MVDRDQRPGQEHLREHQQRHADAGDLRILHEADEQDAQRAAGERRGSAQRSTRSRSPGSIGICMTTIIARTPTSETIAATADPMILPIEHGVARDRGHEELGGEVVLALLDEVGDAGDRPLVQRVRDHPDEHERQVGVRQGAAQVLADAAAQDAHEDDREDDREGDRDRAPDRRAGSRATRSRRSRWPRAPGRTAIRRDGAIGCAALVAIRSLMRRPPRVWRGARRTPLRGWARGRAARVSGVLDAGDQRLGRVAVVGDAHEPGRVDRRAQAQAGAARPSSAVAVGGVEHDRALEQAALHLVGRADHRDPAVVDDADPVGLLGLLEVVRRQEDGRAVLVADVAQVVPQAAAADRVEARGGLVEEQHAGPVHQARG